MILSLHLQLQGLGDVRNYPGKEALQYEHWKLECEHKYESKSHHLPVLFGVRFVCILLAITDVPTNKKNNNWKRVLKGNCSLKFPFYIRKYQHWLKRNVMFFFDTFSAVAAREDRKPKYSRLGRRHLGLSLTLWRHNVKRDILNMVCDCWFPCSCVYWSLVKARKIVWESHVIDSSSITQ